MFENVWTHKYNVNFLGLIQFKEKLYEHNHRDVTHRLKTNYVDRVNDDEEEELEYEVLSIELAGFYGYA